jgi:hypothetical protein
MGRDPTQSRIAEAPPQPVDLGRDGLGDKKCDPETPPGAPEGRLGMLGDRTSPLAAGHLETDLGPAQGGLRLGIGL